MVPYVIAIHGIGTLPLTACSSYLPWQQDGGDTCMSKEDNINGPLVNIHITICFMPLLHYSLFNYHIFNGIFSTV